MYSSSRKFISCMFCESTEATTKEHIFGKALARRIGQVPGWVRRSNFAPPRDALGKKELRKHYKDHGGSFLSLTSTSMCEKCNNDLGKELSKLTALLVKLISGETRRIPAPSRRTALRYFQRIGLISDLESSSFDPKTMTESQSDLEFAKHFPSRQQPAILSPADRENFRNGECPRNVRVYLGRCEKGVGHRFPFSVDLIRRETGFEKRAVFAFNELTGLIAIGSKAENFNPKLVELTEDGADFRLGPLASNVNDINKNRSRLDGFSDGTFSRA